MLLLLTFEFPQQAVLCARSSSKGLGAFALATLCQLPHHAAEQTTQLEGPGAADIGMWKVVNCMPADRKGTLLSPVAVEGGAACVPASGFPRKAFIC